MRTSTTGPVGPCAITRYRSATGDLSAARLTDVVSWRRYRESAVYREYFAGGVGYMLDAASRLRATSHGIAEGGAGH